MTSCASAPDCHDNTAPRAAKTSLNGATDQTAAGVTPARRRNKPVAEMTPEEAERRRAKRRQYDRAWRQANLEKARERTREATRRWLARWKEDVRERRTENQRRYRARHLERVREIERLYRERVKLRRDPRLLMDMAQATLRKALPAGLPRHVRDDVTSDVILAVLEGKLQVSQIAARAKAYLAAHNRMFDQFKHVSIDAPLGGTEGLTLADRLTAPSLEDAR